VRPRDRLHQRAVHFVASRRRRLVFRGMRRLARSYLDLDGNRSFAAATNGEGRVLEKIALAGAACLFDVGANVGDWSLRARRVAPAATVHAFEIVPDTAEVLARATADDPHIQVNACGLAREEGSLEVRYYPSFSEGSGVTAAIDLPYEMRTCAVTTGDAYCASHGIERVDFLKLDVEGAEDSVLGGFARMFAAGAVEAVQFEYGLPNVESHFLLRDFHAFFAERGFAVGKIYPNHVDFRPYDPAIDEDFRGPNYVAVRADRADLVAALSGS
jgi:FkbM family methyltransferase